MSFCESIQDHTAETQRDGLIPHLNRMPDGMLPKEVLLYEPIAQRSIRQPRNRWTMDTFLFRPEKAIRLFRHGSRRRQVATIRQLWDPNETEN